MPALIELFFEALLIGFDWLSGRAHKKGPRATKRGFLLVHPRINRGLAISLWFLGFVALTMLLLPLFDPGNEKLLIGLIIVPLILVAFGRMVLASSPVILVTQREVVQLLPKGRRRRIRFDEVTAVTDRFRVHDGKGKTILVRHSVIGCNDFAHVVLERVPRERLKCFRELELQKRNVVAD